MLVSGETELLLSLKPSFLLFFMPAGNHLGYPETPEGKVSSKHHPLIQSQTFPRRLFDLSLTKCSPSAAKQNSIRSS